VLGAGKSGIKMSDSVTNVEVEDVLSSIRRLVSDDKRPSMTPVAMPSNDRLVLTPALRVAEIDDDVRESVPEAEIQETQIRAWSEFGASPEEIAEDSEGGEEDTAEQDLIAKAVVDTSSENDDDQSGDHEEDVAAEVTSKNAPFVLESAVEIQIEEPAQENTDDAVETDFPVAELAEEQGETAFFASSAARFGAKIAAHETVVGKTDDQWEPDDTGDSDYSGTEAPAMTWDDADEMELSVEDTVAATDIASKAEPQAGNAQLVDDILDEDALRDLVSDIVREELQGALGERITRNVRKLVRREIHRALAAQELE
jgi:hypothetical protein